MRPCGRTAIRVSVDTSLLAHGLLPYQLTEDAQRGLGELQSGQHVGYISPAVVAEFSSILRKAVTRRRLTQAVSDGLFTTFMGMGFVAVPMTERLANRAWEIATRLGQSDTFDAMGWAVAEAAGGEFWTCDQRFDHAARARGLSGVRYFA